MSQSRVNYVCATYPLTQLTRPSPTPKTDYFQDKNLQGKSLIELLFTSKIFEEGTVPRFPPTEPSHLQNLTPKCKILNVFWA